MGLADIWHRWTTEHVQRYLCQPDHTHLTSISSLFLFSRAEFSIFWNYSSVSENDDISIYTLSLSSNHFLDMHDEADETSICARACPQRTHTSSKDQRCVTCKGCYTAVANLCIYTSTRNGQKTIDWDMRIEKSLALKTYAIVLLCMEDVCNCTTLNYSVI